MVAEVEQQRVARLVGDHPESWMEFRAVCYDHPTQVGGECIPPWQSPETYPDWIDAKFDAVEHDAVEHQIMPCSKYVKNWEDIVHGTQPVKEDLVASDAV